MRDPVLLRDGRSYEREEIVEALMRKKQSPVTNQIYSADAKIEDLITENIDLRNIIEEFFIENPDLAEAEEYKPRVAPSSKVAKR